MSKVKKFNHSKGRQGENMARSFLEAKGFSYILSNYKCKWGEIDLIMSDQDCLVFVEVKLKSDDSLGNPEEMIDRNKISQVIRVAHNYCFEHNVDINTAKVRIDAVCIVSNKRISHYINIY